MQEIFSKKQLEFIKNANAHWNLAHGSVRTGKTFCTLFTFLHRVYLCPDSNIAMIGHTSTTIYENAVRIILEHPLFEIFKPFCSWSPSKRELRFRDKTIATIGAKDEGSIGLIQGRTLSLVYCDEFTLYPVSVINMIDTRLSNPYSMGYASMNPSHPDHILKKWIDKGDEGDKNYYSLHFTLDDTPFVDDDYKNRLRNSLHGVFYKRNYLGLWCIAEGAIFEFFDEDTYVLDEPPKAAEYFIAGIDYGTTNAFACVVLGVNTGRYDQQGRRLWVENEYYWDSSKTGRAKTGAEFANDVEKFLEPYALRGIYIDPSAAAFKLDLQRRGIRVIDADNDVINGIIYTTSEMQKGNLFILDRCKNLIKEIKSYVWDPAQSKKGLDKPLKQHDHAIDAMRYAVYTHKIPKFYETGDEFARTLGYQKR